MVNPLDNLLVNKKSKANQLSKQDWKNAAKRGLIFLGPALVVLVASTVQVVPADWKYATVVLFILNRVTDLLVRFLADNSKK